MFTNLLNGINNGDIDSMKCVTFIYSDDSMRCIVDRRDFEDFRTANEWGKDRCKDHKTWIYHTYQTDCLVDMTPRVDDDLEVN